MLYWLAVESKNYKKRASCNKNLSKNSEKKFEITENNCKDYRAAASIARWWNKSDEDCKMSFGGDGVTYYWTVGTMRCRIVRRPPWENMEFKQSKIKND